MWPVTTLDYVFRLIIALLINVFSFFTVFLGPE